jgi:hypothetical protein
MSGATPQVPHPLHDRLPGGAVGRGMIRPRDRPDPLRLCDQYGKFESNTWLSIVLPGRRDFAHGRRRARAGLSRETGPHTPSRTLRAAWDRAREIVGSGVTGRGACRPSNRHAVSRHGRGLPDPGPVRGLPVRKRSRGGRKPPVAR